MQRSHTTRVVSSQDCIEHLSRHSAAKLAVCNFAPSRWMAAAIQLSIQQQAPDTATVIRHCEMGSKVWTCKCSE